MTLERYTEQIAVLAVEVDVVAAPAAAAAAARGRSGAGRGLSEASVITGWPGTWPAPGWLPSSSASREMSEDMAYTSSLHYSRVKVPGHDADLQGRCKTAACSRSAR